MDGAGRSEQGNGDAVSQSCGTLQRTLESMAQGVGVVDLDGRLLLVNPAAARLHGYSGPDELLGHELRELLPEAYAPKALADMKRIVEKGVGMSIECTLLRKDGTTFPAELSISPLRNGRGEVFACAAVFSDITARREAERSLRQAKDELEARVRDRTAELEGANIRLTAEIEERKRVEQALRESEERYRFLFEQSPVGIGIASLEGKALSANKVMLDMLGYSIEELQVLGLQTIYVNPADREAMFETIRRCGSAANYEVRLKRKDGAVFDAIFNVSPVHLSGRDVLQTVAVDMTAVRRAELERRKAEQALKESEQRYRSIFENTGTALAVVEEDMTVVMVNRRFEKVSGYSKEELEGKRKWLEFVSAEDRDRLVGYHRMRRVSGGPEPPGTYEARFRISRGELRDFLITVTMIPGTRRSSVSLIDITEQKQALERERLLQEQLHRADRLSALGQMASGVAHEINNPLTVVIGNAQLLRRSELPEGAGEKLETIVDQGQRIARIVDGLLNYARQHNNGRQYVDLNQVLLRVIQLRSYEMKVANIETELGLDISLPRTMADPGRMQQVFLNIVLNAEREMKLAHGGGRLVVGTEAVDGLIRVSFCDDGPGIQPAAIDHIFEPFFTTHSAAGGTGLGLSISRGVLAEHSGNIRVQSEPGKGATFTVELPVVGSQVAVEKPAEPEVSAPHRDGSRILVVDDEVSILELLRRVLTERGFAVKTAERSDTILDNLKPDDYDLVIMDIKMPGMTGMEFYDKAAAVHPGLGRKMMFITGDVMEAATRSFLARTGAPYLAKPFDLDRLVRDVERVLDRSANS